MEERWGNILLGATRWALHPKHGRGNTWVVVIWYNGRRGNLRPAEIKEDPRCKVFSRCIEKRIPGMLLYTNMVQIKCGSLVLSLNYPEIQQTSKPLFAAYAQSRIRTVPVYFAVRQRSSPVTPQDYCPLFPVNQARTLFRATKRVDINYRVET